MVQVPTRDDRWLVTAWLALRGGLLDALGGRCIVCDRSGQGLCARCTKELASFAGGEVDPPNNVDRLWALYTYEGPVRTLIGRFKYDGRRDAVDLLGTALAAAAASRPDLVTWVPAAPHHVRNRGFDQAEWLARATARALGCPARRTLRRQVGPAQTDRSARERLVGPNLVIDSGWYRFGPGRDVLIVDDVSTTGATLRTASACLRGEGAATVSAVVLAHRE